MGYRNNSHEVALTKSFYVSKYEITQDQWHAIMGNSLIITERARLAVSEVSWNDCRDFIKKLNGKTVRGFRLPTEAEWEYACRAETTTDYSFGDSLPKSDVNIFDTNKIYGGDCGGRKLQGK